jgi:hypothetical protein
MDTRRSRIALVVAFVGLAIALVVATRPTSRPPEPPTAAAPPSREPAPVEPAPVPPSHPPSRTPAAQPAPVKPKAVFKARSARPDFAEGEAPAGGFGAIDRLAELMRPGSTAFNAPRSMNVGDSVQIQALLSLEKSVEELKSALAAAGDKEGAEVHRWPLEWKRA